MFIDQYYAMRDGRVSFTREQGSDFAKGVAGDFNPLHDADGKRFCIPGDLLFAVVLAHYGVSQKMEFVFTGMVPDGVELVLPEPSAHMSLQDSEGREYLQVKRDGRESREQTLTQNLTRSYVEFSGHTFPDILQPLMAARKVMINPTRPMVMYLSMSLELDTLDIEAPQLEADQYELEVDGRRGAIKLAFNLVESGAIVGRGCKRMLASGLREYDAAAMQVAVDTVKARKAAYTG